MTVIWDDGPMPARDVHARLADQQDWAYSTVKTLLRRMVAKGWLEYDQIGNSFLYRPAVHREKAVRRAVREFSARVLNGALAPFVAYYAETHGPTDDDIADLEAIIRQHRKNEGDTP